MGLSATICLLSSASNVHVLVARMLNILHYLGRKKNYNKITYDKFDCLMSFDFNNLP